jgi:hypothetical protein
MITFLITQREATRRLRMTAMKPYTCVWQISVPLKMNVLIPSRSYWKIMSTRGRHSKGDYARERILKRVVREGSDGGDAEICSDIDI